MLLDAQALSLTACNISMILFVYRMIQIQKKQINETINDYYSPDKATGDAVCQKSVA